MLPSALYVGGDITINFNTDWLKRSQKAGLWDFKTESIDYDINSFLDKIKIINKQTNPTTYFENDEIYPGMIWRTYKFKAKNEIEKYQQTSKIHSK